MTNEKLREALPKLDNWIGEFSLTDEADVLDDFTLGEQARIWGLMRTAWDTAAKRTAALLAVPAEMRLNNTQRAFGHIVFEESSADVDEATVNRLAELLERVEDEEADWWHRKWHQDTGIPCDGSNEFCPLTRRRQQP